MCAGGCPGPRAGQVGGLRGRADRRRAGRAAAEQAAGQPEHRGRVAPPGHAEDHGAVREGGAQGGRRLPPPHLRGHVQAARHPAPHQPLRGLSAPESAPARGEASHFK